MFKKFTEFISSRGIELVVEYGSALIYSILTLIVGLWIIKAIKKLLNHHIGKVITEEALVSFIVSTADMLLKIMLFITIASMLGVQTTSFMAILGTIGLGVGLALQGSLANFAGGVLILLFKPFKKGDFVTISQEDGFIERIDILATTLRTRLNRIIIIPNSKVTSEKIINHFDQDIVRRRFYIGISHDSDIRKAKDIILEACLNTENILEDPGPFCEVVDIGESAVEIRVFIWLEPKDYFRSVEPCIENIKYAFDENGIIMPYPQRVLHFENQRVKNGLSRKLKDG